MTFVACTHPQPVVKVDMSTTLEVQLVSDAEVRHVGVQTGLFVNSSSRGKIKVRITHGSLNRSSW